MNTPAMAFGYRSFAKGCELFAGPVEFYCSTAMIPGFRLTLSSASKPDRGWQIAFTLLIFSFILHLPFLPEPAAGLDGPRIWKYGFHLTGIRWLTVFWGEFLGKSWKSKHIKWELPWAVRRPVRLSIFRADGTLFEEFRSELETNPLLVDEIREKCRCLCYEFRSHDGRSHSARCLIEEMEVHQGTGLFRWVSWFRKPLIRRHVSLKLSEGTGVRTLSWEGGSLGHSAHIKEGETLEFAFRRWCDVYGMRFVGRIHLGAETEEE